MTSAYMVGVLCGVLFGGLLLVLILRLTKKDGSIKCKYDERQELVRGKGYKYAFFSLLVYIALVFIVGEELEKYMEQNLILFIGLLGSVLIYVIYCVWKEGYFSLNESPKRVLVAFALIAFLNFFVAAIQFMHGEVVKDGVLTYRCINLLCGIMFVIIFLVIFVKRYVVSKEEGDI